MNKLLLVDCDGTIREPKSGGKFILHPLDQKIIAGADNAIAHYHKQGWVIVGITNQSGVAAGYKQLVDAIVESQYTLELLPQILCIYLCPDFSGRHCWLIPKGMEAQPIHQADWAAHFVGRFRKPQPGMLLAAMKNHLVGKLTDSNCWYIGDRSEDEEAAIRAGVQFMDADIWRERWRTAQYKTSGSRADIETQLLLSWLQDVIPVFFTPMRDRIQELISNERLGEVQLGYLGQTVFDDLIDHLEPEYQSPQIEQELVDWEAIGRFLRDCKLVCGKGQK